MIRGAKEFQSKIKLKIPTRICGVNRNVKNAENILQYQQVNKSWNELNFNQNSLLVF